MPGTGNHDQFGILRS